MASRLERLPTEIILLIAEFSSWVVPDDGYPPYRCTQPYAALTQSSRLLFETLNPALYSRNIRVDAVVEPRSSCIFWAADKGCLDTIKRAESYGANIRALVGGSIDKRRTERIYLRTPLHVALRRGHRDIVHYLLENGARVDIEAEEVCRVCRKAFEDDHRLRIPFELEYRGHDLRPWPLHTAIYHSNIEDAVDMLVYHGATHVTGPDHVLPHLMKKHRTDLIGFMVAQPGFEAGAAALHYAIEHEDMDLFLRIPRQPVKVTSQHVLGSTALGAAALARNPDFTRLLLEEHDVDANSMSMLNVTALHFASTAGNLDVVRMLLQRPEVDASVADLHGRRALHNAASESNVELARLLLQRPEVDVLAKDDDRLTPLHFAIAACQVGMVKFLMEVPAINNYAFEYVDACGQTLLHGPCRYSEYEHNLQPVVDYLISHGLPLDSVSFAGTPFYVAVREGNLKLAIHLLSLGANPSLPCPEFWPKPHFTPLAHCIVGEWNPAQPALFRKLLAQKVFYSCTPNGLAQGRHIRDGSALLFAACRVKSPQCMEVLLRAGARPRHCRLRHKSDILLDEERPMKRTFLEVFYASEWDGDIPVQIATIGRSLSLRLRLLLSYGAMICDHDRSGILGLAARCATSKKSFALLRFLLENSTIKNICLPQLWEMIQDFRDRERMNKSVIKVIKLLEDFEAKWFRSKPRPGGKALKLYKPWFPDRSFRVNAEISAAKSSSQSSQGSQEPETS